MLQGRSTPPASAVACHRPVPSRPSGRTATLLDALFRPHSLATLCALSLVLGAIYALSVFPLSLIAGNGPFWSFPRGTIAGSGSGSADDLADPLVGYLYLMHAPWGLPLLHVSRLGGPSGTNIFWLDALPWVSLLGKLLFTLTGLQVNLLGAFVFLCFSLPGVAMTALLALGGQRSLVAALAATVMAETAPFLWFGWGHLALSAQVLVIAALCSYAATIRWPTDRRVSFGWLALLELTLLTNLYLLAMVGSLWAAGLAQRCLQRSLPPRRWLGEAVLVPAALLATMLATGILTPDLGAAGTAAFGVLSMNLASMVVPQMSGVVPGLAHYRVGMGLQHEGFAYLGLGMLLVLLAALRFVPGWLRRSATRHGCGIALLVLCFLFALSNRVYLGSHLLLDLELPPALARALGSFRSSGRFIWPVDYALIALGLLLVLRHLRRGPALALLALACVLQLLDVRPLRALVAASAAVPRAAVLDRAAAAALVQRATSLRVYPSYGCVRGEMARGDPQSLPADLAQALFARDPYGRAEIPANLPDRTRVAIAQREVLLQANMEFMLLAARANRPTNTVYNARLHTDCPAERREMRDPMQPHVAYVFLTTAPAAAPPGACRPQDWFTTCLLP
jgi:hypothetical protein